MTRVGLGIDIGGSGVKGALVDLDAGEFIGERVRIETPYPATPEAVAKTARKVADLLEAPDGIPTGVAMPAPISHDIITFMANLDQAWVGVNAKEVFEKYMEREVVMINDADAAGVAEDAFGAAKDANGTVIVTTLGTGIGSALIYDGVLVPNTELGHIELDGHDAESEAAASQRVEQGLSWEEWAKRLERYYSHLAMLFSPDLIVVGGGVSRNHKKFMPLMDVKGTKLVPATLFNTAGIVGAAVHADKTVS